MTTKIIILGVLYILLTIIMKIISLKSNNWIIKKASTFLTIGFAVGLASVSILSLLIISELKSDVETNKRFDYIVVLGAGLEGDQVSDRLKIRLDTSLEVIKNSDAIIIVSGGQGQHELISEADAMYRYLVKNRVAESRIIKEEESTSTQENIRFSNRLMTHENSSVLIVTSDYHMYRAKMLGKRVGWEVYGKSGNNNITELSSRMVREVLALAKDIIVRW